MNLLPAIRNEDGKAIVGTLGDHHDDMDVKGGKRGFVQPDGTFINRIAALEWIKKNQFDVYKKLFKEGVNELHTGDYYDAMGIDAAKEVDVSNKTIIIYDRGIYTYLAEFLAQFYGKVIYYRHQSEVYPQGAPCQVGSGIPDVEWTNDFWGKIDKADDIFFPYVFDGGIQAFLRKHGYPVCGSGKSEKIEHEKWFLKEKLKEVGLPVIPTYHAKGLDDLEEWMKGKQPKMVIKSNEPYRGDWETHTFKNKYELQCYINTVRGDVGPERAKEMDLLVEKWIESACESGYDGFRLRGKLADWPTIGFEIKDEGYIARAIEKLPEILQKSENAIAPVYDELEDCASPYSCEGRITEDGKFWRTDETLRGGNPPAPCFIEMYGKQYAQAIDSLAHGKLPKMKKPDYEYGAEIVLQSAWYIKHELHVGCPKDFGKHIKLNNMYMKKGQRYCDPVLSQDDINYFGSIVGFGKTHKEATDMALEKIKEIDVYKLNFTENIFDQAEEVCDAGKKWGIVV